MQKIINIALKGMAMGIAEVIPGVSGGTIAFITGIYEKLINTIKAFHPRLLKTFKNEGLKATWEAINGNFLVNLMVGMAFGVVVGVFGVTHLLENYPILVWSFFFGLIIASAIYVGRQVEQWNLSTILAIVLGTVFAYFITVISPAEGNHALWFVFISGMIAISALILPGISGSFILLIMGMYTYIIPAVKDCLRSPSAENFKILVAFGLGCIVGLASFSRVLSWAFKNFKDLTLALLTGFMIGSLNKIWPWKKAVLGLDELGNEVSITAGVVVDKILKEENLMPGEFADQMGEPYLWLAICAAIIGFFLVFFMDRFASSQTKH